ncbi:MAG TPA: DNRLRE domain-containing protein [Candidatus Saccharimonadales bacterium]
MIRRILSLVVLSLVLTFSFTGLPVHAASQPELVSLDNAGMPVTDNAYAGLISGSGRYVAYDTNSETNGSFVAATFVRDRMTGTTVLASILPDGSTAQAGSLSGFSKDGRSVVFSADGGLYVHNLDTDQTVLASIDPSGMQVGDGGFSGISENGSRIAFGANNNFYVRDLVAGVTRQITSGGYGYHPAISADGNFVAYNNFQTYVYSWTTDTSTLASVFADGTPGNRRSVGAPAISDDGRYVAFANNSTFVPHDGTARIYRRDMQTGQMLLADVRDDGTGNGPTTGWSDWKDSASLAISGDGNVVAFGASNAADFTPDITPDVGWYARNFTTGRTGLATAIADGTPVSGSPDFLGSLTTDGAFTTFTSNDPLLGVTDGIAQVFVNSTVGTGKSFAPPEPLTITLDSQADTHVRSGQSDRNYGTVPYIRVQSAGDNRGLVRFDQDAMQAAVGNGNVVSAKLRFTITDNGNNWGSSGRTVDVHRLLTDWSEGTGTETNRGSGPGATWNCAIDDQISNQVKNCSGTTEWQMGQPNNPLVHPWVLSPSASQLITNGQTGAVEYDVTADVTDFVNGTFTNYGWLVKKTNEGQNGQVSFGTRETVTPPQLIITYQP